jgi:putative effector of murein hydrolase
MPPPGKFSSTVTLHPGSLGAVASSSTPGAAIGTATHGAGVSTSQCRLGPSILLPPS